MSSSIGEKPQVAPYSGAILPRVARSAMLQMASRPAPKNSTNLPTTPRARNIWRDGQHKIGGGEAFLHPAGELEADHLGQRHRQRLAEHRGFRLDAADAPAEHGQTVDHRRVRVGAD